jgi:cytochrome d ubiquinol oxidase subunit II
VAGLVVLGFDATGLFDELVGGAGLPGLAVSAAAGLATVWLLWTRRYEAARYLSALAVAAIIAGWALAQNPVILPGLTIERAAAPNDALIAVLVAVVAGGAILLPSFVLLFRLALGGQLGDGDGPPAPAAGARRLLAVSSAGLLGRTAIACLLAGIGLLTIAGAGWAHAVGVAALMAFVVLGFVAAVPALLPAADE